MKSNFKYIIKILIVQRYNAPENLVHSQVLALSIEAHSKGDETVHLAREFTLLEVVTRSDGGHPHFRGVWRQNHKNKKKFKKPWPSRHMIWSGSKVREMCYSDLEWYWRTRRWRLSERGSHRGRSRSLGGRRTLWVAWSLWCSRYRRVGVQDSSE